MRLRTGPIVHATIATRIANAINDSNSSQPTDAPRFFFPRVRLHCTTRIRRVNARPDRLVPDGYATCGRADRTRASDIHCSRLQRAAGMERRSRAGRVARISRRLHGTLETRAHALAVAADMRSRGSGRRTESARGPPVLRSQSYAVSRERHRWRRSRTHHRLLRAIAARLTQSQPDLSNAALCTTG